MLKLTADLWNNSLEILAHIKHGTTDEYKKLEMVFDTGAYMTCIEKTALLRAGYNYRKGKLSRIKLADSKVTEAYEVVLNGFKLGDKLDNALDLGAILVYAIDAPNTETPGVLGLNVIREFKTMLHFGNPTVLELFPQFDTDSLVTCENFMKLGSRFGEWTASMVGTATLISAPTPGRTAESVHIPASRAYPTARDKT